MEKPKQIISTKGSVKKESKCHEGVGVAIQTPYGEVIILAANDYTLRSVVGDICPTITLDNKGMKDITVFSSKNVTK